MQCGYCFYGVDRKPVSRAAEFVINGQSVCEDHVDTATTDFGKSLNEASK
jgi:hypothetical protein